MITVHDFFQEESEEALRAQVKWQFEHLKLDVNFFAKLLGEDRCRFSSWLEEADTLDRDKENVLRDWWQTVLHLLSFQRFDDEKLRSLLEQTRPMSLFERNVTAFPSMVRFLSQGVFGEWGS